MLSRGTIGALERVAGEKNGGDEAGSVQKSLVNGGGYPAFQFLNHRYENALSRSSEAAV